jgi:hypothetical protein
MAITANTIPSQVPFPPAPYDAQLAFCSAQTLTATGYLNNVQATNIDLGGGVPVSAAGRTEGLWCMDITAIDFTSGDETYLLALLGSNDSAFGNGNVELIALHDFAAAVAGRVIPTLLGVTPTIPPANVAGTLLHLPFTNLIQRNVFRYLRARAVIGGTTPSITLTSWLSYADNDH